MSDNIKQQLKIDKTDISQYCRILGQLFYLDSSAVTTYWAGIPPEQQADFLKNAQREGADIFCCWRLGREAVEIINPKIVKLSQQRMLRAMRNEAALRKVYLFFESKRIRFAPIKGADLAYRIYPFPSLRLLGDFDIFFHPEDLERAQRELMEDGWKEQGHVDKSVHHHLSPLVKDSFMMEPHWTLSNFGQTSPYDIWNHVIPVTECRHVLSPELNVLLLTRHVSSMQYNGSTLSKLLLDCAFCIQKEGCDWVELRRISAELHQPYPGNLLAAFPEFFPPELIKAMEPNGQKAKLYRKIFEEREKYQQANTSAVTVSRGGIFTLRWWSIRLTMLHPRNIRKNYGLPERGGWGKLLWVYLQDLAGKCCQLIRYTISPDKELCDFMKMIDEAER